MTCNLNCYTPTSATPVSLPGASGSGTDIGIPDLTMDECRAACKNTNDCEAVVHVGYGKGTCYGKKDIHTSAGEGGCQVQPPFLTEFVCGAPWGKCSILGDPHITPFDRKMLGSYPPATDDWYMAPNNIYSAGEYYLVDSPQLQIRGRFGYAQAFRSASSALGVAVAGPLLGGHILAVAYIGPTSQEPAFRGWKVTWDGEAILTWFPSDFSSSDGMLHASFADMDPDQYDVRGRSTIGGDSGLHPSFVFSLGQKQSVNIYVLPGPDICNIVVSMRKLPGQDGLCGNFNCNWDDDTKEDLQERGYWKSIGPTDSLFPSALESPTGWDVRTGPSPEEVMASCPPSVEQRANCQGTAAERETCLFDACMAAAGDLMQKSQLPFSLRASRGPFGVGLNTGTVSRLAFAGSFLGFMAVSYMWWSSQVSRPSSSYRSLPVAVDRAHGMYRLVPGSIEAPASEPLL